MHLFFLRHGIAHDALPGQPDSARRLTAYGTERMRQEANFLAKLDLKPDLLLTSPYPRAAETAAVVQEVCRFPQAVHETRLASGAFRLGVLQSLTAHLPLAARVILVGHEPDFSQVVQQLCGAVIDLKKGGLAYVEAVRPEPNSGVLRWLLAPAVLTAGRDEED